jgi:hypothetical protein
MTENFGSRPEENPRKIKEDKKTNYNETVT